MSDKGCLLSAIGCVVWILFWAGCISIGDDLHISPFLVLLMFVGILVIIIVGIISFLYLKSVRERKREEKVNKIKTRFPLAYKQFTQDIIKKGRSITELKTAKDVIKRPLKLWSEEEDILKREEEQRRKTAQISKSIAKRYPHGIKQWKLNNKKYTHESIIEKEAEIAKYEKYHKISKEYENWEREQSVFTKQCREISSMTMPNFGKYKYKVPFKKIDNKGKTIDGEYVVWQFFVDEYCNENDLDLSDFEYIKKTTNEINEYKERRRYFPLSVTKQIRAFINKLAETYDVSVYLCVNNKEWNADNLTYYYFLAEDAPFCESLESVDVCDPATDASLFDEVLNPDDYPSLKNRHVIIVEVQTDNNHLMEVCRNIVEINKSNHPLITYISLLKGYDRTEMLELIERKKKEKAEKELEQQEKMRMLQKKQDVENDIKYLPKLIESNNIEIIESKIQDINDNIVLVTSKEKEDFERIKVDYKRKKELGIPQKEDLLFVNYDIPSIMVNEGNYAIVRMPQKGCIVWPYRRRTIARRGYTEQNFENILKKYFPSKVDVLGDINILPQNGIRPYEPDIAIIYSENNLNLRIDIEIDEPYAAVTNKPTHYIGCGDDNRDAYLNCLGWIVIRFSERQVYLQSIECVKFVAEIIKSIDNTFDIPNFVNAKTLTFEKQWSKLDSQKMAEEKYRQKYLNHEFGKTEESVYNIQDLKLTTFETSILSKVKQPIISHSIHETTIIEDDYNNDNNILYNKTNEFELDHHIKFDVTRHLYTIDGIQYKSVSTVISEIFPEFDSEYWAKIKSQKNGIPSRQIIEEWELKGRISREVGTFLHQQIENFFLKKTISNEYHFTYQGDYVNEDSMISIEQELSFFKDFLNEVTIHPFRSEWRIFDKSLKIAGTIDLISKNKDGSYDIYDWKRSSRLHKSNLYQSGLGQLSTLEDTPRNHYYLQQNLYRYILEHQYRLNINSMYLVGLHPSYGVYDLIEVPKMDKETSIIIQML